MRNSSPSSNLMMAHAVLLWVIAWWLADLVDGAPMESAMSVLAAAAAMGLAISSATHAVRQPSPFRSPAGQLLWALRPRKWMITWGLVVLFFAIFGRPMILNWYGGGRCQYIDWWLEAHWRPAHGDGLFQGCRFLVGW